MDTDSQILTNLQNVVGCNGLRDFTDLVQMRQDTLERRLARVREKLSANSMASIYTSWLCRKILRLAPRSRERDEVVKRCCTFMCLWGIDMFKASEFCDTWAEREMASHNRTGAKQIKARAFSIRDAVLQQYPEPARSQKRHNHVNSSNEADTIQLSKPVSAFMPKPAPKAEIRNNFPEPQLLLSQRRNVRSLTLDTNNDSRNATVDELSSEPVSFDCLNQTISPVPKTYRCNQCGKCGHLIKDCPENSISDVGLPTIGDDVCHYCGTQGDGHISNCPKFRYSHYSSSPRGLKRKTPGDHYVPSTVGISEKEEGRLSPYESSSNASGDLSPKTRQIKRVNITKRDPQNCGLSWRGGWASSPSKKQATSEPTWGYPPGHVPNSILGDPASYLADQVSPAQPSLPAEGVTPKIESTQSRMAASGGDTPIPTEVTGPDDEPITPKIASPLSTEAHMTEKKVKHPAYGTLVIDLFSSHSNTWVNVRPHVTALDMWEPKSA